MSQLNLNENKKKIQNRLARIEGQIRGINKLIENDANCIDVAQQITAARKALDKTFFVMIGCMIEQGEVPQDKIVEILKKLT